MLLSEAFNLYARDVIVFRNQSISTEIHHSVALKSLLNYGGDTPISELTFEDVRRWKASLESRGLSPLTIRGYLIKLRVVLAYANKKGYECLDPELIQLSKAPQRLPEFLTSKQVSELIKAAPTLRTKAIIALLYGSGIRVGELVSLNRSDLRPDGTFTVIGKGNKLRLCFLDERSQRLINEYLKYRARGRVVYVKAHGRWTNRVRYVVPPDNHPALFVDRFQRRRLKPKDIQMLFMELRQKLGIKETISPHWLRHSYATNLAQNGAHLYTIKRLLGHQSIQTTEVYLHISDIRLQEEYKRFHSV